ncbi:MAG: hypothetical protein OXF25_09385 [Cyanobacteria bacterium MAG CAR3_bin_5]|nr:hypothetical protein [Cyanobacteria bacterium MAG CAR3_bin_5]
MALVLRLGAPDHRQGGGEPPPVTTPSGVRPVGRENSTAPSSTRRGCATDNRAGCRCQTPCRPTGGSCWWSGA